MRVQGYLLTLPNGRLGIPVPWLLRVAPDLQTGKTCFVAIVEGKESDAPDLIISMFDPEDWQKMIRVECNAPDCPGVVTRAVASMSNLDIVQGESVTSREEGTHQVTLFCCPPRGVKGPSARTVVRKLESLGFTGVAVHRFKKRKVLWSQPATVTGGWVEKMAWDWRKEVARRCSAKGRERIDLGRAMVYSDDEERHVRFVFAYRGVRSISIHYRNESDVLKAATEIFAKHGFNLLSTLGKSNRSSQPGGVLLATFEPKGGRRQRPGEYQRLRKDLRELGERSMHMVDLRISSGTDATKVIAPREADTVVARVPPHLTRRFRELRRRWSKKPVVFTIRRFPRATDAADVAVWNLIDTVLERAGCETVAASPETNTNEFRSISDHVSSLMWAADAALVVVTKQRDKVHISRSMAHEIGSFLAHGKPVFFLRASNLSERSIVYSDIAGFPSHEFPAVSELEKSDMKLKAMRDGERCDAIERVLLPWLARVQPRPPPPHKRRGGAGDRPLRSLDDVQATRTPAKGRRASSRSRTGQGGR